MKGKVKFFNTMKNFGFIQPENDGDDLFVHMSDIVEDSYLREDDEVEFDAEEGERGPRAVNVKKLN